MQAETLETCAQMLTTAAMLVACLLLQSVSCVNNQALHGTQAHRLHPDNVQHRHAPILQPSILDDI